MKPRAKRNHLSEWRRYRGMTQEQLAEAVDSTKATISRLEAGKRGLSQKWLERLAPALDVKAAELLEAPGAGGKMPTPRMVPLINSVQAGHWTEIAESLPKGDDIHWVPAPAHVGPRAFGLEIDGPSMLPDFRPKDIIIVDPDRQADPGDFVVACVDDENVATFKRLRIKGHDPRGRPVAELVPLNPDWPTLTMKKGGKIVGVATDLIRRLH